MKTFIPLEDWQTREVEKGIAKGNTVVTRRVIAADNWNWSIALEKKDGITSGTKFYGSLRFMLPCILALEGIIFENVLNDLVKELATRLGGKVKSPPKIANAEEAEAYGHELDDVYDTSFCGSTHPPTVTQRLFGASD